MSTLATVRRAIARVGRTVFGRSDAATTPDVAQRVAPKRRSGPAAQFPGLDEAMALATPGDDLVIVLATARCDGVRTSREEADEFVAEQSRVFTDPEVLAILGSGARLAHVDCTAAAPSGDSALARTIRDGIVSSSVSPYPFARWYATDARCSVVYRCKPCICCNLGLRSVADVHVLARSRRLPTLAETGAEVRALRCAAELHREHARLRAEVARDAATQPQLDAFVARLPSDGHATDVPCRSSRLHALGIDVPSADGGAATDIETMLAGPDAAASRRRDAILDALTDAALDDRPVLPHAAPHLGLLYLTCPRDELYATAEVVRGARQVVDVGLHELPVPASLRERAAAIVCRADGVRIAPGDRALDVLARQPRAARAVARRTPETVPAERTAPAFDPSVDAALAGAAPSDAAVVVFASSRLDASSTCPEH